MIKQLVTLLFVVQMNSAVSVCWEGMFCSAACYIVCASLGLPSGCSSCQRFTVPDVASCTETGGGNTVSGCALRICGRMSCCASI